MNRSMKVWLGVLLVGIAIVVLYLVLRGEVPAGEAGGMGAAVIVPVGYFVALIGAGGLVVAWMRGRAK